MSFSLFANHLPVTIGKATDPKSTKHCNKAAILGSKGQVAERFVEIQRGPGEVIIQLADRNVYLQPRGGISHGGLMENQQIIARETKAEVLEDDDRNFVFIKTEQENGGIVYQHKFSLTHHKSKRSLYLAPDAENRIVLSSVPHVWKTALPADPVVAEVTNTVVEQGQDRIAELEAENASLRSQLAAIRAILGGVASGGGM